jgi:hypothetical protein
LTFLAASNPLSRLVAARVFRRHGMGHGNNDKKLSLQSCRNRQTATGPPNN